MHRNHETPAILVLIVVFAVLTGCVRQRPVTPGVPYGPQQCFVGVQHLFQSSTTDPQGDQVLYRLDWGDGDTSEWALPDTVWPRFTTSHAWQEPGTYVVRAQARDLSGNATPWSDPLVVDVASDTAGFPYPCRLYRDIVVGTWPERVAASHDGKYVYATLPFSSQVAVIRTSDWTVTALINVGPVPRGVAVRPQGDYVYVANSESNYVSVVDVADCAEVAQIPVGRGPWDVAVSPDGSRLWTTCYYDYRVAAASVPENVLDTTIPLEPFPQGIAISPSGDNVFVVGAGYYLHIIDAQSREVTDSVQLDGYGEYVGALSNDSGVVVSGWRSDWERCSFVERITRESWGWSREYERFTMGSLTLGSVALLPGDGYAFVCGSREVLVLDMRGFMPVAQIPLGTWPSGLAVSPDGRYVYVANDTTVTVIGH